jgi:hypothetical protein
MSGDSVHAVEGLKQRVRALNGTAVRLVTLRDRLRAERASKQGEVQDLSAHIELLTKVSELFRVLMDLLVVNQVRSVESVVTEGLRSIFHDLDLTFEADVDQKYGKVAIDFFFRQGAKDNPLSHRGKPLGAFGGGPSSVASLILRVLTVLRLKLWPLLALDEALGAVSDDYIDATARFLRELAGKVKADILLVTHKQGFLEHADQAYRCTEVVSEDGKTRHLTLRSVK